jgi:hypothetical protein
LPKFGEVAKIRLESHSNGSSGMTGGNNINKAIGEATVSDNEKAKIHYSDEEYS